MEIKFNTILKLYMLDFEIEIDEISKNFNTYVPNRIIKLTKNINKHKSNIYTHKSNLASDTDNKTWLEASINEIELFPEDIGLKNHSHKKFLKAYISSAFYISTFLSNKFGEEFIVVFNYFISNEISHDLRYYKLRSNEEWLSLNFVTEPSSSGLLLLKN